MNRDDLITKILDQGEEYSIGISYIEAQVLIDGYLKLNLKLEEFDDRYLGCWEDDDDFCNDEVEELGYCLGDYIVIDWDATNEAVMKDHCAIELANGTRHYFKIN